MNTLTLLNLSIENIDMPEDRARGLDAVWVEALAASIDAQGLFHPVTVRPVDGRFRLVAGRHRIEAARNLGWQAIPARISEAESDDAARLEEVMENLARHELIALDRCHHLYELKQAWEAQKARPMVEVLADGGKTFSTEPAPEVFGFARSVAEEVGLTKQAINLAVKIWTDLSAASRRRLVGTDLARKQTELKALSELKPVMQAKVLDLVLGDAEPGNVAQALAHLENGVSPTAVERRIAQGANVLGALDEPTLDAVLVLHREKIVAAVKRLGWV